MLQETIQYACGLIDETLKVWSPKNLEEIKCTIKGLRKIRFFLWKKPHQTNMHFILELY